MKTVPSKREQYLLTRGFKKTPQNNWLNEQENCLVVFVGKDVEVSSCYTLKMKGHLKALRQIVD